MHEISRSHFLSHGSCEKCGSKDNVAWYSNGSGWCFGCGTYYASSTSPLVDRPNRSGTKSSRPGNGGIRPPPDDCNTEFPDVVIKWVSKYDLDASHLIKYDVKWSKSREQLIYFFYGEDSRDSILWQARNFRSGTTHKTRFFTSGSPEKTLAMYYPQQASDTCVLVEDCVSAIKIAMSGCGSGVPCFSAAMSEAKLTRLSERFKRIVVWLDSDKFGDAVKLSNRAKLLGCESNVLHTSYDPKEYNLLEIERNIK
jgi:hypothetical protein